MNKDSENKRQRKHSGSIFQDKKSGNWIGLLMYKGQRIKRTGITKKSVIDKLNKYKKEVDQGLDTSSINVKKLAYDFIDDISLSVTKKTAQGYKAQIDKRILPTFAFMNPRDITRIHANNWIKKMDKDPSISNNTIRVARKVAIQIFEQARKNEIVAKNVFADCNNVKHKKAKLVPMSDVQSVIFLTNAKEDKYGALFNLLLKTGMRVGESLGLTWDDINFSRKEITINKQFTDGEERDDAKTEESNRTIKIGDDLLEDLKVHQIDQLEYKSTALSGYNDNNLVFANEVGNHISLSNLRKRHFKPLLDKSGITTRVRIHDLRHTFASINLMNNVPLLVVSKYLGHSSPRITLEVYADYIPDMSESPNITLERILKEVEL